MRDKTIEEIEATVSNMLEWRKWKEFTLDARYDGRIGRKKGKQFIFFSNRNLTFSFKCSLPATNCPIGNFSQDCCKENSFIARSSYEEGKVYAVYAYAEIKEIFAVFCCSWYYSSSAQAFQ